jgi:hypothetical protein
LAPCDHEQFKARVSVAHPRDNKDQPDAGYSATITIRCGLCGELFEFLGVSAEPSTDRPMVAHDGVELRIPLKPKGEDQEPKKGIIQ